MQHAPSHRALLAELAGITGEAIALQPRADRAIRACGVPEPVPDHIAVELGAVSHAYSLLHLRVEAMEPPPDLAEARREVLGQLSYHLHMLRDAGDLVFSGRTHAETDRFRRELGEGLGPHALDLAFSHDRLLAQLADAGNC